MRSGFKLRKNRARRAKPDCGASVVRQRKRPSHASFSTMVRWILSSKRKALAQLESVSEISAYFRYAYYDSVQNEVIATWQLGLDRSLGNDYMDEYYRLPECLLDRSVLYQK